MKIRIIIISALMVMLSFPFIIEGQLVLVDKGLSHAPVIVYKNAPRGGV